MPYADKKKEAAYKREWESEHRERKNAYYQKNKELFKTARKKYWKKNRVSLNASLAAERKSNPVKYILIRAKHAAKKKGIEFNLCPADIYLPETCPVFGMPLTWAAGKRIDSTASLDRRDNGKGYTAGNVRVISWKANRLKSNGTLEDFERIIHYMKEQ